MKKNKQNDLLDDMRCSSLDLSIEIAKFQSSKKKFNHVKYFVQELKEYINEFEKRVSKSKKTSKRS